jgi:hypothetical protein
MLQSGRRAAGPGGCPAHRLPARSPDLSCRTGHAEELPRETSTPRSAPWYAVKLASDLRLAFEKFARFDQPFKHGAVH